MADKVEVIVIGAGLAGLSAAYALANAGIETVVVERGDFPGGKNVSGGRLYLNPVRQYLPGDFWDGAPFERTVVKERLSVMAEQASTTLDFYDAKFSNPPHSVTVLRARLDQWLADKVSEKGALIIPKTKVDDLIYEGARVVGVKTLDSELRCDVVVAADGALSFIAEKAGLRARRDPLYYGIGVKEVIELSAKTIDDRFGVGSNEGVAQLFFGTITQGMVGGGFIYTNRESISLGMVVGIRALMRHVPPFEATDLMEMLKARPEIAPLIEGGNLVEYSAHVIPEGGIRALSRLVGEGLILAGDAAGLALNMGITVRGMDFALASGALAARAITDAKAKNDFSAASLSSYEQLLRESFVIKDLQSFRGMAEVLENPRMFHKYPTALASIFERIFWLDDQPKDKLSSTALRQALKDFGNLDAVRDALALLSV